jgi:hypothetical protein
LLERPVLFFSIFFWVMTRRRLDAPLPKRPGRTYGDFLVEACALWSFIHEARTKMTREEFVAEVATEIQEEDEELAQAAVDALFRDGFFRLEGPYVRCTVAVSDLTEPHKEAEWPPE